MSFTVCVLGADKVIKQTIQFDSESRLTPLRSSLYLDDSIQTIKNKILRALGLDQVSYKELHLFAHFVEKIDLSSLLGELDESPHTFRHSTGNIQNKSAYTYEDIQTSIGELDEPSLTTEQFCHFISNYKIDIDGVGGGHTLKYIETLLVDDPPVARTLGRRYENTKTRSFFSVDPFQCSSPVSGAPLLYDETAVLLSYGQLHSNTIYVCLASDVLEYAVEKGLNEEYICSQYFPYLFASGVNSVSTLGRHKQELIAESNSHMPDELWKLYEMVDMFYDIQPDDDALPYENAGITYFSIGIKTGFVNILPLDSIFKNIHSTANMPFIKYNPGSRRESMYRLYSEHVTTAGKRKPILPVFDIMRLSRDTGKSGEISIVTSLKKGDNLHVDFQKDGSLRVHSALSTPISIDEIVALLKQRLNPIIDDVNAFIEPIGYKITKFESLRDPSVEILNICYKSELVIKKPSDFDLNPYRNCISSLFVVEDTNIHSDAGAKLRFRRVNNFQSMNLIDEFISVEKKNHVEVIDIIGSLAKEFRLDEETARNHVAQFFAKYATANDNNAGFPVSIRIKDKKLHVSVENIDDIAYIDLLHLYIDSVIRIFHAPKTMGISLKRFQTACKRELNFEVLDAPVVERPREREPVIVDAEFFPTTITDNDGENDENDEDVFGMDVDDDELVYGGADEDNVDGMKLKNPNPFQKRIEDRDPELINQSKDDKSNQYSRTCSHAHQRQPVIIDSEERERINTTDRAKGKFTNWKELLEHAVERKAEADVSIRDHLALLTEGDIPMAKPQFEIAVKRLLHKNKVSEVDATVQRIWDFLEPMKGSYLHSISVSTKPDKPFWYICPRYWSLKDNRSLTKEEVDEIIKTAPNAIIPPKSDVVPKGSFIYEFAHPLEHFNERGEYIPHYPGFIKNAKAKYEYPCCFKRDQQDAKVDKAENSKLLYIAESNKVPIQPGRWGFLPQRVQDFFKVDNHKCVSKLDANVIEQNKPCLLRFGVEHSPDCSILACFADIYAYVNDYDKQGLVVPSIANMRQIITKAVSLDHFLSYSLSAIFRQDSYVAAVGKKYESLVDELNEKDEAEMKVKNHIVGAYENFLQFINDEHAQIDHTYMWDMITKPNDALYPSGDHPNGINLVILEILRDSIELVCPTNAYADTIFDARSRVTFILLKQGLYYEPVYIYEDTEGHVHSRKLFHPTMEFAGIKISDILTKIESLTAQFCRPKRSLSNDYKYHMGLSPEETISVLRDSGFVVKDIDQVVNYQFKTVGFNVKVKTRAIFVPCRPSHTIDDDFAFVDDVNLWNTYDNTRKLLKYVYDQTGNKIKCVPVRKVLDKSNVIGFITATNMFVKCLPPISLEASEVLDAGSRLETIKSIDFISADKNATTNRPPDEKRRTTIRGINEESSYYTNFRSVIRSLLGMYENRKHKLYIIDILNNDYYKYHDKLRLIEQIVRRLTTDEVEFSNDPNLSGDMPTFPLTNRITGKDNKRIYYGKLADELVRHGRVRSFLLEPKHYLNISNTTYKINDDEILLLDSSVNAEYLNELNVFDVNTYVKNISYDIAVPDKAQRYSNTSSNA